MGCRLYSPRVGLWAGLILASSLNFGVVARAATPDTLLIFYSTLALAIFVEGASRTGLAARPGRLVMLSTRSIETDLGTSWLIAPGDAPPPESLSWRTALLMYGAMGMGVLVKGPVGVVLPTAALGMFLLCWRLPVRSSSPASTAAGGWAERLLWGAARLVRAACRAFAPVHFLKTTWSMRPLTALAVVLTVAGPWYAIVGFRTNGEWLAGFFGIHNIGRFMAAMENHRGPIFYYLPAVLIGLFPWSVLLIPFTLHTWNRVRHRPWTPADMLLASWAGVWIAFFSLASTKLPSYVLPAYPALALFTAGFVARWAGQTAPAGLRSLRIAWVTLGVVGVGLLVTMPILARRYLDGDLLLGLIGLVPLLGAVVCWHWSERGQMQKSAAAFMVMAVLFITGLFGFAAARVDRHQNSEMFADLIRARSGNAPVALGSLGYFRPSLVFYADRPVGRFKLPEEAVAFFQDHSGQAYLFTTDEELPRFASALPPDVRVLASSPRFLKSRNVLLLGRTDSAVQSAAQPSPGVLR